MIKRLFLICAFVFMTTYAYAVTEEKSIPDYDALSPMAAGDMLLVYDIDADDYKNVLKSVLMGAPGAIGGTTPAAGTFTSLTIGSAGISEAELEILDGATLSTTQINYLSSATGTTGTTSANVVFSIAPTITGTMVVAGIDGSGTFSANLFTPDAADSATLGTADLEFSDLFLATSGVIYGENGQANTLTSSATGWIFNLNLFGANAAGPAIANEAATTTNPTLIPNKAEI